MYTTRRFWLVLIAAISGLAILACSCNSLLPSAAPTSFPILPPSPATVSAPTSEPLPTPEPPATDQAFIKGELPGSWLDPESGTVTTIMALEGGYTIDSVIHPDRGGNEYASSSWTEPVLTWTYCIPQGACITNETITLNGNSLETNWWDDQGGSGSTKMRRVASPPPLGREAIPGMAGRWLDPDSTGTYHLIVWENGKYIVAASLNPETGENEVTTSTWADGVLIWTYCVSGGPCVTTETVSYSYGSLNTKWSNDQGYSGSTTMERMP